MLFLQGKDRGFEQFMQEPPYNNKAKNGMNRVFKYTFADLDCQYCIEKKSCPIICLCPYILDNLPDLLMDTAFLWAVDNANACEAAHKRTLLYIKEHKLCG